MRRLWAPWRHAYVSRAAQTRGCIFCTHPKSKRDAAHFIFLRSKNSFAMLNLFPYTNGHMLIAPYRHVRLLSQLTDPELVDLWRLVDRSRESLDHVIRPHAYNLGINLGRIAGAGVLGHVHVHLVPRWQGDTNFMTSVADVKVIPQSLRDLHRKLAGSKKGMG